MSVDVAGFTTTSWTGDTLTMQIQKRGLQPLPTRLQSAKRKKLKRLQGLHLTESNARILALIKVKRSNLCVFMRQRLAIGH